MANWTKPQFLLPTDIWTEDARPWHGIDPGLTGVLTQIYIPMRSTVPTAGYDVTDYTQLIQVRFDVRDEWMLFSVFRPPDYGGTYLASRAVLQVHQGFPNQYVTAWCQLVDSFGVPIGQDNSASTLFGRRYPYNDYGYVSNSPDGGDTWVPTWEGSVTVNPQYDSPIFGASAEVSFEILFPQSVDLRTEGTFGDIGSNVVLANYPGWTWRCTGIRDVWIGGEYCRRVASTYSIDGTWPLPPAS